jgi:hypothetical protein
MRKILATSLRLVVLGAASLMVAPGSAGAQRATSSPANSVIAVSPTPMHTTFSLSSLIPKQTTFEPMVRAAATVSIGLSREVTLEGGIGSTPLNGIAGAATGRMTSAGFSFRFDAPSAPTKAKRPEQKEEPARTGGRSAGVSTTGARWISSGVVRHP